MYDGVIPFLPPSDVASSVCGHEDSVETSKSVNMDEPTLSKEKSRERHE
jgi:hypothetical protein